MAPPVTVEPFLPSWCVGEEEKPETEATDDIQGAQDEGDDGTQDDGNDEPEDQQEKEEKVALIEEEG